ncbi:phage tail protein [Clostridium botulinum]|uniref:phage tail protein n=1 Tax=Clostridium botulinum TaxID=1491 RepID=UPI001C9AE3AE|nr:phage tail protein [Clostridium botulinum]MBY6846724.1 phage tail protein [Clostridium botulinum]
MADGRIIIDTEIDSSGAKKGISNIGSLASNALGIATKTTAVMVTAATGAVAALTKLSIAQYAEYEQLTGGVETLFKKSSGQVMEYANNAYKTAGMSANEYMSTITGFSASLLQGLGGDTKKAAQIGNMAVTDMADNANKMGTAIGDIQNAYQGFAKQNYTMLDNLKLGYGGTKTEMERLLADAQKLTGIKYDINNFSDVIEAIHAVQNEMGITGTTAKEASSTIEGSLNMTKAAWTNLLTGMADDNADFDTLINNFVDSVSTLGQNLLPRIEIAINGIGNLINKLLPPIIDKLPELITSILPGMLNAGVNVVSSLVTGFLTALPQIIQLGLQLIIQLGTGIAQAIPELLPQIINVVIGICDMIIANIGTIMNVGIQIIIALVQGLIQALPTLIENIPRIINEFSGAIFAQLPTILMAGIKIILMLIKGLIQSIPTLIANIPAIIMAIFNALTLFNWASAGRNLIKKIGSGIESMGPNIGNIARSIAQGVNNAIASIFTGGANLGRNLISNVINGIRGLAGNIASIARSVASSAINAIKSAFSGGSSIGSNLIRGIWNGISNMGSWIKGLIGDFASGIIAGIKEKFKIHSPSRVMRDEVGKYLAQGIGVGFSGESDKLKSSINEDLSGLVSKMQTTVDHEVAFTTARVVANRNTPTSSTITNHNDNGLNVNIENFNNTKNQDIQSLMEELEFYRKQNSLAKGGV